MDLNSIVLSAGLKKVGIHEGRFPSIWALVHIEASGPIEAHNMFVRLRAKFKPGTTELAVKREADLYRKLSDGAWITAWNLLIDSFTPRSGNIERRSVRGSLKNTIVTKTVHKPINHATLVGRAVQIHGQWVRFGMSYLNPKASQNEKWQKRHAKLLLPQGARMEIGKTYFVSGALVGKDLDGNDDIIVLVDKVH